MSVWTPAYRTFNPADPAVNKSANVGRNGVNPGYASAVGDYNSWLYTPQDRRGPMPGAAPAPVKPSWMNGWQQPQMPQGDGQYATPYSGGSASGLVSVSYPTAPTRTGTSTPTQPFFNSLSDIPTNTAPSGRPDGAQPAPGSSPVSPPQNALQRWQSGDQRNNNQQQADEYGVTGNAYLKATHRIDARATTAQPQGGLSTGGDRGYTSGIRFNNSPSGWEPY